MNAARLHISCIFRYVLAAGVAAVACGQGASLRSEEPGKTATAAALMRQAHDGRAEWRNFQGFEARLRCTVDGAAAEGTISVDREGKVKLSLPEGPHFAWVQRPLDSLVGHRLAEDEAITNVEFADSETEHPHGRLLRSLDPKNKSMWRVKGDVLTEVHRNGDDSRFIISIADVERTPEGKHLPRNFVVTTWELPSGRIQSVRQVYQEWRRFSGVDLPTRYLAISNRSDGTTSAQQIELFDHRVPVAAAAR